MLAACGPKLLSLAVKDGSIASQWTSDSAVSQPVCLEVSAVQSLTQRSLAVVMWNLGG